MVQLLLSPMVPSMVVLQFTTNQVVKLDNNREVDYSRGRGLDTSLQVVNTREQLELDHNQTRVIVMGSGEITGQGMAKLLGGERTIRDKITTQ